MTTKTEWKPFVWGDEAQVQPEEVEKYVSDEAIILAGEHAGYRIPYDGLEIVSMYKETPIWMESMDQPGMGMEIYRYRRFKLASSDRVWYYYVPDEWEIGRTPFLAMEHIAKLVLRQRH